MIIVIIDERGERKRENERDTREKERKREKERERERKRETREEREKGREKEREETSLLSSHPLPSSPCVGSNASVCRFQTLPCVGSNAHDMFKTCARFEPTHGSVL